MGELYNRLKALCDARGVSLAKMCEEAGIPKSTPTELKAGRTKSLSTSTAQKVANYFGVTVDELLGGETNNKIMLTPEERSRILDIFERAIKGKNISENFVLTRVKVQNNIFNQLRNWKFSGILKRDLISIAQYLDVLEEINLGKEDQSFEDYDLLSNIDFDTIPGNNLGMLSLRANALQVVPVYENVSAGFGATANNYVIDYAFVDCPTAYEAENTICAKVTGDSMYPKIENGDTVQILKTDSVDSGTLAVVLVDKEEAFVKKIVYGPTWIELHSINPMYPVMRFEKNEMNRVDILGQVKKIIKNA